MYSIQHSGQESPPKHSVSMMLAGAWMLSEGWAGIPARQCPDRVARAVAAQLLARQAAALCVSHITPAALRAKTLA